YYACFDGPRHRAHPRAAALEVEQQIRNELTRPVIRDLPATVDLERRDAVVAQKMLAPSGEPQRVDRRMFSEPDLIACRGIARGGEALHRVPGRLVVGAAERARRSAGVPGRRSARHHSTIV